MIACVYCICKRSFVVRVLALVINARFLYLNILPSLVGRVVPP